MGVGFSTLLFMKKVGKSNEKEVIEKSEIRSKCTFGKIHLAAPNSTV